MHPVVLTERVCPVCGSAQRSRLWRVPAEPYYRTHHGVENATIVRCLDCGLAHTNPVLPPDINEAQYLDPDSGYNQCVVTRPEEVVWTDQIIGFHELREHLVTDALILDVGCGDGGFVYLCQKAGFRAAGMELNRAAADRAASLGIRDISQATLVDYGEFSLDCVVTLHVLEHLADCRNFAAQFARVLRPGGLALVVVPNYGSVRFRVQPLRYWTAPYQHMNGLCSDSLDGLFLSFGFERLSLRARWLRTGRLDIWTALSMSATRVFGNALGFFPTKLVALYRKQLSRQ